MAGKKNMMILCVALLLGLGLIQKSEAGKKWEEEMDCFGSCLAVPGEIEWCMQHPVDGEKFTGNQVRGQLEFDSTVFMYGHT